MVQDRNLFFQLGRNFHDWRHQDNRFEAILQMQSNFLEAPDNGKVVPGQERMKVFEDKEGRLNLVDYMIQRRQGIAGCGYTVLLGLDRRSRCDNAGGAAPLKHFLLTLASNFDNQVLDAHLFAGNDIKDRIARAYQGFQLGLKCHRLGLRRAITDSLTVQATCATRTAPVLAVAPPIPPTVGQWPAAPAYEWHRAAALPRR